jgi:RimJ/RimL family protein N-acetyltransferase
MRIANHLDGVRLRKARWADRLLLLGWANDPETRRNSSTTEPIPLDTHLAWLRRNLADPRVDMLIAHNGLGPIGVLRLAPGWRGESEVSINIAPQHRGGVGTLMLRAALARWHRRLPDRRMVARIKPGNTASEQAFARVGFRRIEEDGDTIVYARPPATVRAGGPTPEETAR